MPFAFVLSSAAYPGVPWWQEVVAVPAARRDVVVVGGVSHGSTPDHHPRTDDGSPVPTPFSRSAEAETSP